jgi:spermine oxidase
VQGLFQVDSLPHLVEFAVVGESLRNFKLMTDEKVSHDSTWLLRRFLKTQFEPPINVIKTKWLTEDNFLGSYAYPSMTFNENSLKNLVEPILNSQGRPAILFAGEATSEKYQGYVHGALDSGWRVAQQLIDSKN